MMNKFECRQKMKAKLSLLDEQAIQNKSVLLSKNLSHLLVSELYVIQKKLVLGLYAPLDKEPRWNCLLPEFRFTAFPSFEKTATMMTFKLSSLEGLECKDDFGVKILGPLQECPVVIPDVIILPGLAFSKSGERLGRGKGFYDKYLSNFSGVKVGVCFSDQLEEEIPTESHDIVLDYIVTENEIINCKVKGAS